MDPKRSQQVGIFIQSMKAKSEELFEALVTLNIKMDIDLMKGNGQWTHIEGFQFRWSKNKEIHAAFAISITLLADRLNKNPKWPALVQCYLAPTVVI